MSVVEPLRNVHPFVIDLAAELDASVGPTQVRESVGRALAAGHRHLVLDFHHVRFLDTTTMGALVSARQEVLGHGGRLILTNVSPQVLRFLRVTGVASHFEGLDCERLPHPPDR